MIFFSWNMLIVNNIFFWVPLIYILDCSMAGKHHKKDERDPNGRLLSLVRWACRERYEVLCLRPFMVKTPSISFGRGRHVQVHWKGISDRELAHACASDSKRATSLSHYQHLHQTPEDINFHYMIDLECQEETNAPPPESFENEDDHAWHISISLL
jgi:hypothetical protein